MLLLASCDGSGGDGADASPTPTASVPRTEVATPTPSPTFVTERTQTPTTTPTATPTPEQDLEMHVSWDGLVEPPENGFAIRIEMADAEATYGDWVLGDVSGQIASGRLARGESTTIDFEVNWAELPLLDSNRLFYVHARGDDGSSFAQVVQVDFDNPPTDATPTPTAPCGYADFEVTTPSDLSLTFPESSFIVGIANEGLFGCGDLEWWLVAPPLQPETVSCSPTNGLLEGPPSSDAVTSEEIECFIEWNEVPLGETTRYFLVLFSYPKGNGTDSAHLVAVRLTRPKAPSIEKRCATVIGRLRLSPPFSWKGKGERVTLDAGNVTVEAGSAISADGPGGRSGPARLLRPEGSPGDRMIRTRIRNRTQRGR